jgi:excisionase family DNA binding protein
MTAAEAAKYLGVSNKRLRAMAKGGSVPHVLIGRRRYFSRDQFARWIENGGAQPKGAY